MCLLLAVIFPIVYGALLFVIKEGSLSRKGLCRYTGAGLIAELLLVLYNVFLNKDASEVVLLHLTDTVKISLFFDTTGRTFAVIMTLVWVLAGFFSFEYMEHEQNNRRYFSFYLMSLGVLSGLCESENMITFYAFYELMTISTFALVIHNQSKEAIIAALKYLFYSFAGAYMALFGIYFAYKHCTDGALSFAAQSFDTGILGGVLPLNGIALFLMLFGFSVKAGMFPMHGWLPTAHPVAPAPASAVLSAIIVKAGVLGILRTIYNVFGVGLFSGSWVQMVMLSLSIITIFMGSMLAYREKILKKRLAYSTVSQVSYILFALFTANQLSVHGAFLHVASHAAIKSALFLIAGAIIYNTGCTRVDELRGIGKKMPVMMSCFIICSLGLIGIPPLGGFISKWYIGIGALSSDNIGSAGIIGVAVLLISALLTAGYLLPIAINAFLPGEDFEEKANEDKTYAPAYLVAREPHLIMLIPIIILTLLSVLIGIFPEVLP